MARINYDKFNYNFIQVFSKKRKFAGSGQRTLFHNSVNS